MERYCLENPNEKFNLEKDPTLKLLAKKGDEHEQRYLEKLINGNW